MITYMYSEKKIFPDVETDIPVLKFILISFFLPLDTTEKSLAPRWSFLCCRVCALPWSTPWVPGAPPSLLCWLLCFSYIFSLIPLTAALQIFLLFFFIFLNPVCFRFFFFFFLNMLSERLHHFGWGAQLWPITGRICNYLELALMPSKSSGTANQCIHVSKANNSFITLIQGFQKYAPIWKKITSQ